MFKEYRKIATVKAKLFEKGDEDGFIEPHKTALDAMEDHKYGIEQAEGIPYISTIENQKHRGKFSAFYVCIGIKGERWLVEKEIFESTYECISDLNQELKETKNNNGVKKKFLVKT